MVCNPELIAVVRTTNFQVAVMVEDRPLPSWIYQSSFCEDSCPSETSVWDATVPVPVAADAANCRNCHGAM
eukprot:scaffold30263_cov115-Amphora_coffeaeformis.AAC.1